MVATTHGSFQRRQAPGSGGSPTVEIVLDASRHGGSNAALKPPLRLSRLTQIHPSRGDRRGTPDNSVRARSPVARVQPRTRQSVKPLLDQGARRSFPLRHTYLAQSHDHFNRALIRAQRSRFFAVTPSNCCTPNLRQTPSQRSDVYLRSRHRLPRIKTTRPTQHDQSSRTQAQSRCY